MIKAFLEWLRWLRKQDWELVDVTATEYSGLLPTLLCPYFYLTWRDKRTGKFRVESLT